MTKESFGHLPAGFLDEVGESPLPRFKVRVWLHGLYPSPEEWYKEFGPNILDGSGPKTYIYFECEAEDALKAIKRIQGFNINWSDISIWPAERDDQPWKIPNEDGT